MSTAPPEFGLGRAAAWRVGKDREQLHREFQHLRNGWWWLFGLGVLLAVCGAAALIVPAATLGTSLIAMILLGVSLMIGGIGTIVASFYTGKGSTMLLHLLTGILYVVAGFVITDRPLQSAVMMAAFVAALFMVAGVFRIVAAAILRFPYWGWALVNGLVTFLCGAVIYRHFSQSAIWVVGVLVGVELLLHGWNWIMLSLAIRSIPAETA
jgi:uncharacterized membrane protein HdeD (DUF308 family)